MLNSGTFLATGEMQYEDWQNIWSWFLVLAFIAIYALLISEIPAFAEKDNGADMPWEEGLGKIRQSLSGPVAFAISIIAIIAAGVMLVFGGDMQGFMKTAAYLALVIGIIIAANNLLENLYSTSAYISFGG